jgi:hypothetical protein
MIRRGRHQVFDNFVTTVGTNGTITFPLRDAENSGITTLRVGPGYRRTPIRFFVKMPSREEAAKLPAPLKSDRETVTFEPLLLYVGGPLPPHCTAKFTRVLGGDHRGKIKKKPLHHWSPLEDTTIYPAAPIELPSLRPGEAIEFEGVSWFFNARPPRAGQQQRINPFAYPLPPETPPDIAMRQPVHLMLLVKMKWLPKEMGKSRFRVVQGSPVGVGTTPTAATPEAPAPEIPTPSQETS